MSTTAFLLFETTLSNRVQPVSISLLREGATQQKSTVARQFKHGVLRASVSTGTKTKYLFLNELEFYLLLNVVGNISLDIVL